MVATYNSLGRMTHETWCLNNVEKARYIYAYNGAVQNLTYDRFGNVIGEKWTKGTTTEADIQFSGELVQER